MPVGRTFRDCPDCPELVVIPAGRFLMGSPETEAHRDGDEGPQRELTLRTPLAIGRFEVTFAEWDACVAAGGCETRPEDEGWGRGRQPVIRVSWNDAQAYLAWLSRRTGRTYRLPTEAEWEYAARAGTATPFATGAAIAPGQAVFGTDRARPVGGLPPNAWGLHDVHGNVAEWVADCYAFDYRQAPEEISRPAGSPSCFARVLRGGSWGYTAPALRVANRSWNIPGLRANDLGFRVVRMPN